MNGSAFDVIGPSMIGPSSSHTAGAVRIGLIARDLMNDDVAKVAIELHGSFAATGAGHATDRGLISGLLGYPADDDRLKDALTAAAQAGMEYTLTTIDLGEYFHPNSVRLVMTSSQGEEHSLIGSSTGGGKIDIVAIDDYETSFDGSLDTLVLWHLDQAGFLAKLTALLACVDANIATILTSRRRRAREAVTVVELDALPPAEVLTVATMLSSVSNLSTLSRLRS